MIGIGKVAETLGVSTATIRKLVEAGELPAYTIGSRYRFVAEDVKTYIERNKVQQAKGKDHVA